MSTNQNTNKIGQKFGGTWTLQKLEVLKSYLKGYTTALKKQKFKKGYIDAFAGTGFIDSKENDPKTSGQLSIFDDSEDISEFKKLHEGSARVALKIEPHFDKYIYIDNNPQNCSRLMKMKDDFPKRDIAVFECDANQKIQELCDKVWTRHRAVMFLDPFGMQVDWETIKCIAKTESIDLWLFLPIGVGVNRLLKKSGKISDANRDRLDRFFGTKDWYKEFYHVEEHSNLFGFDEEQILKTVDPDKIGKYYNRRLKEIFAGVLDKPAILKNSRNSPIFQLFFAVGNERGKKPALSIAKECMKSLVK